MKENIALVCRQRLHHTEVNWNYRIANLHKTFLSMYNFAQNILKYTFQLKKTRFVYE